MSHHSFKWGLAMCFALMLSSCSLFNREHEAALEHLTPIHSATDEELFQTLHEILTEYDEREEAEAKELADLLAN